MTYIVFDHEASLSDLPLGGKAEALARLYKHDLPIPRWFAIASPVRPYDGKTDWEPDSDFPEALSHALEQLAPNGELLAVRSSALEEDGAEHSHAGLLESYLFVPPEQVLEKVKAVWQSAFNERVLAYRAEHGLPPLVHLPAVLVQRMINANSAGVAFSADPVSGQREVAVVSAIHGLGLALVSGECNADTAYIGPNQEVFLYQTADKAISYQLNSCGELETVKNPPELISTPVLREDQACIIAHLARSCEAVLGWPQDIEWAIEADQLFLLQSRPITTLAPEFAPTNPDWIEWDNTTLVESWNGPVTPLTFSVAHLLLEALYQELTIHTCVPKVPLSQLEPLFQDLPGHICGRIYLNQSRLNQIWLQAPSLEYLRARKKTAGLKPFTHQAFTRQVLGLNCFSLFIPWHNHQFTKHVNQLLVETLPQDGEALESLLLKLNKIQVFIRTQWKVPSLNNYLATQRHQELTDLSAKWLEDETLPNIWLADDSATLGRELSQYLAALAKTVSSDPALAKLLAEGNREKLMMHPQFGPQLRNYLNRFGERCQDDLKMESASLSEDPSSLFQTILLMSKHNKQAQNPEKPAVELPQSLTVWQKLLFRWLLKRVQTQVKNREQLRFELSKLMNRLRGLSQAIGQLLHEQGLLREPRDILFLALDEITHLEINANLLEARKQAYMHHLTLPALPACFGDFGALRLTKDVAPTFDKDMLTGIGCSAGKVQGQVYKLKPGESALDVHGKILVADHGDPGLVIVFPLVKGLLFENGGALSHAAIVARELGVPAVTALSGIMGWLENDDWVELDGQSGQVRKVTDQRPASSKSINESASG